MNYRDLVEELRAAVPENPDIAFKRLASLLERAADALDELLTRDDCRCSSCAGIFIGGYLTVVDDTGRQLCNDCLFVPVEVSK